MPRPPSLQKKIKKAGQRSYLAKDFDSFRADLLRHARTFFPDKINDFSDASLGGLFLDLVSTVGDSLTYFLDHQFNELNPMTAIEPTNIINHLKNAGVPIVGASPAVALISCTIEVGVEVEPVTGKVRPARKNLPVINEGTVLVSANNTKFTLVEDINFGQTSFDDKLTSSVEVLEISSAGLPSKFKLTRQEVFISGKNTADTFSLGSAHVPFRKLTLAQTDISEILSVTDSDGNEYYEVSSLAQDTVFGGATTINTLTDESVEQQVQFIPAPYRFVRINDPLTRLTTLQFGSGAGDMFDDDIIPDPTELAIPLYGKKTFNRFTLDPNKLLQSQTLGISPRNTTLAVNYRHGGGLSHNVDSNSINTIDNLKITFPKAAASTGTLAVRNSLIFDNRTPANGGLPAPTLEELRAAIPSAKQSQDRIVSKADALARIYTLPSKFGRTYRAAVVPNPSNPLATNIHIISRDRHGNLVQSSDALKLNIRKYFNEYRLISDAIDILDTRIINFGVEFKIVAHPNSNKVLVLQDVISKLADQLRIDNFQIGQPIVLADLINIIINANGVISISEFPKITSQFGTQQDGETTYKYASTVFSASSNTVRGLVICPSNSIFELKFPQRDIVGTVA